MDKKILYIIIAVVLVLALVLVGVFAKNLFFASQGVNYQQQANGTQTYSNDQGSVTVGSATSMPEGWPSDVPANYAGAVMSFSGNSNPQTGKAGAAIAYTVPGATTKAVVDYYVSGLKASGWTIEGNMNTGTMTIIAAKKDGRTFGLSIGEPGNNTVVVTAGLEL